MTLTQEELIAFYKEAYKRGFKDSSNGDDLSDLDKFSVECDADIALAIALNKLKGKTNDNN